MTQEPTISLCSLGKRVSGLMKRRAGGGLTIQDNFYIRMWLDWFDGITPARFSSRVVENLDAIMEMPGCQEQTRGAIRDFVATHPALKVPVQQRSERTEVVIDAIELLNARVRDLEARLIDQARATLASEYEKDLLKERVRCLGDQLAVAQSYAVYLKDQRLPWAKRWKRLAKSYRVTLGWDVKAEQSITNAGW